MTIFDANCIEHDEAEAGVHLSSIGDAIMIWTTMQMRERVTVAEAMLAFNTTQQIIVDAIDSAHWVLIVGKSSNPSEQLIETDGE